MSSKQGILRTMPFANPYPGREDVQHYPRKEDKGIDACLFREFLQNSRDAGATRVDFTLSETDTHVVLVAADNGKGMNYATIENGLVTFAGSVKAVGAAGGFGMAKQILVYSPDETTIITTAFNEEKLVVTHEYVIKGVNGVLQVTPEEGELRETNPTPGTTFIIRCPKSEVPSRRLEPTADGLRFLLTRCDFRGMAVFLNGELIPDAPVVKTDRTLIRTFKTFKGEAHYWKDEQPYLGQDGTPVAVLAHRGIWVNDIKVNGDFKGRLMIDVDDEPKKVLNPSRITLAYYTQQQELGKFTNQLAAGAHSTLKPSLTFTKRYDGAITILRDAEAAARAAVEQMLQVEQPSEGAKGKTILGKVVLDDAKKFIDTLASHMADVTCRKEVGPTIPLMDASPDRLVVSEPLSETDAVTSLKTLVWSPALMIHNELEWEVDKKFTPEFMNAKVRKLLTVWNEFVRQLLIFRRKFIPYGVGLIFSDDTAAQYQREADGTTWFLINPINAERKMRYQLSCDKSRNLILDNACHEVAHACDWGDYHGDTFVKQYSQNVVTVLNNRDLFNRLWRESK